jgi:hypothetical protein
VTRHEPEQWRHFDPGLFDILVGVVSSGHRNVRALEGSDSLPGAIFADEGHPIRWAARSAAAGTPRVVRQYERQLHGADLVFVDPDNGPAGYRHGSAKAGKSVLLSEPRELARPGRCLSCITITADERMPIINVFV